MDRAAYLNQFLAERAREYSVDTGKPVAPVPYRVDLDNPLLALMERPRAVIEEAPALSDNVIPLRRASEK